MTRYGSDPEVIGCMCLPYVRTMLATTKTRTKIWPTSTTTMTQSWMSALQPSLRRTGSNETDCRYEDEEDTSYKIRRSSTKLLSAVVATRPELLSTLYKEVSPVLISRFGDREETVKLEVWATYGVFLTQTRLFGGIAQTKEGELTGVKRKRENEGMELEETPQSLLRSQVPLLAKALLNQMKSPKANPGALQAGFDLLNSLLQVLPGALSAQTTLIASISKSVLTPAPTTSTSTLHLACLSFLRSLFSTHSPPTFSNSLPTLTPALLKSLAERHPRIASEGFRVFSALLGAMRPPSGTEWADKVYDEALNRLSKHDTDAEVRSCAEDVVGDLWVFAPEVVKTKGRKEWEAICRTTGRTDGAVKVVTKVAKESDIGDDWVNGSIEWILTLLKKGGRAGKPDAFICLEALLRK
jgi:cullin-associated NEDD8-dissociated protein 1